MERMKTDYKNPLKSAQSVSSAFNSEILKILAIRVQISENLYPSVQSVIYFLPSTVNIVCQVWRSSGESRSRDSAADSTISTGRSAACALRIWA